MVTKFLNLDTDGTLSANSDDRIPSQKAIKTYVDSKTGKGTDSIDCGAVTGIDGNEWDCGSVL